MRLNPFTGRAERVQSDRYSGYQRPVWSYFDRVYFNANLTRAVYSVGTLQDAAFEMHGPGSSDALWRGSFSFFTRPHWSPDGSQLAVIDEAETESDEWLGELYLVQLDGHRVAMPDTIHPHPVNSNFAWSPDGRTIAAWLETDSDQGTGRLVLIDVATQRVRDTCLISGTDYDFPRDFAWSPDSQTLAVGLVAGPSNQDQTVLIDLAAERAFFLIEGVWPVGWMTEP